MEQQQDHQSHSIPHHTRITFIEPKEPGIFFNSCFDSGNMSKVNRNSYDHYSIWTAADAQGTPNQGYPKSWFYFEVGGFFNRKITFSVHRVHFLWSVSKRTNLYRPVYKIVYQDQQTKWERLPHPIISLNLNEEEQLVLKFDFFFTKDIKSVKFAFIYPYSYEQQRNEVLRLKNLFEQNQDPQVFFKQYELIKSYQQRILDLIIISSHEGKDGFENIKYDEHFDLKQKMVKFRNNKPIIFVSARVHPIETPSSFCMKGIIDFLLDKKDYRAHLLRKYFVFALVPMLNPDGVSNGHCRMDQLNQNLNRYYNSPDPVKQSPCYAVRKLCEHYQKDNRMFMYLDLHAHPATKGNFMFGNAIYDFIQQVQSQVFPKILSQNCINFEFQNCIFSRKHMKAKDRNEDMNKQGCGRVVLYKDFGIPHAYTLECGYHMNSYNNKIQAEKNTENKYIVRYRWGKNKQKIYENVQKPYTNQTLIKVQQSIRTEDLITQQNLKINNKNSQNLQAPQVDQSDDIKATIKSLQNNYETKSDYEKVKIESNKVPKNLNLNKRKIDPFKANQTSKAKNVHTFYDGYDIFEFISQPYDDIQNAYYKREVSTYNTESFQNLGRNIMITILDIFNKNPYSRAIDLNEHRRQIAEKQSKLDRFRKEQAGIRNKMKNIVQLIEQQFYSPWIKRNVFGAAQSQNNQRARRNKTLQFQIVKSSQKKTRNTAKEPPNNVETKRHLILQSEVIKTSIGNQNSDNGGGSNKLAPDKSQEYENRNTLLAKKIKSFKSKTKGTLKELSTKQSSVKQDVIKKSIALPVSQNLNNLEEQIRIIRNQGLSLTSKIIKHPSYNMASLRMRSFVMQGSNAFSSGYGIPLEAKYQHGLSLGNEMKK